MLRQFYEKLQVSNMRQSMIDMVHAIQDEICEALRSIDGVDYRQDEWTREEGGGG